MDATTGPLRLALVQLNVTVEDMVALVGFAELDVDVYNSLAVLADGEVKGIYRKMFLPNYGVFDEQRYFQVGDTPALVRVNGATIGLTICEEIWEPGPPLSEEALAGAEVIVNISASPYHHGKGAERERMLIQRARDYLTYVAFCNLVGGQDELVFDGHSLVVDQDGELVVLAELESAPEQAPAEVGGPRAKPMDPDQEVYAALVLGLRDYVRKNDF